MATNTYNKVIINGTTYIDLSTDTVAANKMLSGTTAHDKNGAAITGSIATKNASSLTASGKTVTVPAGYYASQYTKDVATGSATTPATTITAAPTLVYNSTSGKVEATVNKSQSVTPTVTAGYVSAGTAGTISVSGSTALDPDELDEDIVAGNIKSGVEILGITGTFTSDGTAVAGEILSGKTAYVGGSKVTGTMSNRGSNNVTVSTKSGTTIPAGYYDGGGKAVIDSTSSTNLIAGNIKDGITILGITGTLEPSSAITHMAKSITPMFSSQTFLPSGESTPVDYYDSITVAAISVTEAQTTGTTGYTVTVS